MKAIWLFAVCFAAVGHCSAEIMLNDVVLGDADSYYLDEEWGKPVRPIRVAFEHMLTTDGFEFKPGSLEDIAAIWEVEIGDILTNSTHQNFTAIPDDRFRPMGDILARGESRLFGYGAVSFWMQNDQEPGFQVFGWMHLERSADDGLLRVLESVGSYGPESTVEEGRYHLSPGIIVGTTQVPEPSAFHGMLVEFAGISLLRRRRPG